MGIEELKNKYVSGYGWKSRKPKYKQHILDEKGRTYCNLENSGYGKIIERCVRPHVTRTFCNVCTHMLKKRLENGKPSKRTKKTVKPGTNFYRTKEWARLRYMAFERYGTQCMCCGGDQSDGVRLHVDHIKPIRHYPELALDIENLQILCALCNRGKGSEFETDWRRLDDEYREIMRD